MSRAHTSLILALGLLCLAGCNRNTPENNTPEKLTPGLIKVEPAQLACNGVQVVTVRWDATKVQPEMSIVEIWTGPKDRESIFASGGKTGQAVTGPWALPGTIFTLKEKSTGKVVSRTVIDGPPCG